MVNTRSKIKKTQNTLKTCFSQAPTPDSDHQSTHSGALIGSNDDLLTQILLRLPVTSILRFKSVSKQWRWLLSHQCFTLAYDSLSISPGLFVRNIYVPFDGQNQSTPPFRTLDFYPDINGIRIIQSCNGLLLCCSDGGYERSRKYYVFNPTTKQFAVIPSVPGGQNVRKSIGFMGLAFHQTDCPHYKIVCIHGPNTSSIDSLFRIQIYSSITGKWKISNNHIYAPSHAVFRNAVYWNGAIHWAPSCLNPSYFILEDDELQNLPLPPRAAYPGVYSHGNLPIYFGESRGHLHLVEFNYHEKHLQLYVYEMLKDHSGWFVKFKVEVDDFLPAVPELIQRYQHPSIPHYSDYEIFDVVRGEEDEDTFIVLKIWWKIIRYNVVDKSFMQLLDLNGIYHGRIAYSTVHLDGIQFNIIPIKSLCVKLHLGLHLILHFVLIYIRWVDLDFGGSIYDSLSSSSIAESIRDRSATQLQKSFWFVLSKSLSLSSSCLTTEVWDYFDKLPVELNGVRKAGCNACGKVYSANPKAGTSDMKRHIPKFVDLDEPGPQKNVLL
ncbi:hypothetical protein E3N88_04919 [Mikania micrantha]|uniref:F-box domain-containing protein n=1 Tax=Mikania micrantha TaxID=192012 RepID=A0A5N6PXV3_9ASTR|nr:hypothetical protein E3N88_04919 [Mikania micrantha]